MVPFSAYSAIDTLINKRVYAVPSYTGIRYERFEDSAFRIRPLVISLVLVFASSVSAGEGGAFHGNLMPELIRERNFEIIDVNWDDFSFKVPVPVGESHKILRGEDIEGGENFTIVIYRDDIGYLFLSLSSRSLTKDQGVFFQETKPLFLLSETNDGMKEIISMTLRAKGFITKRFGRNVKIGDHNNALIYQAEVLCDYDEYECNLIVSIGIMNHDQYSYYSLSINFLGENTDEWNNFFAWNNCLAGLQ